MKTRPGHLQIRLPEFVAPLPNELAIELNWYSKGNRPGSTRGHSPHMSLVISSALAGLARESTATRNRILRTGLRAIRCDESRRGVPGSSRVRAFRINSMGQLEKLT
jgi:hypothetical protein